MGSCIVRQQIDIKAEPSRVWDALTNPDKTEKYFFNCKVYSTWQVGKEIRFEGRIFLIKKIVMKGRILSIIPCKHLQYTLANASSKDGEESFSTVTDELSYKYGITTLSITDDVSSGKGAESRYNRSQKGWYKVLKSLKKVVEEEVQM